MGTNGTRLPWYDQGLRFQCRGCGDCCRGPGGYVWVNAEEIGVIAAALSMETGEFGAKYLRRTPTGLALVDGKNGDCPFLDQTGRCAVYAVRPVQCRTWPWWRENLSSPEAWADASRRCPGMGTGDRHSRLVIETESSKEF